MTSREYFKTFISIIDPSKPTSPAGPTFKLRKGLERSPDNLPHVSPLTDETSNARVSTFEGYIFDEPLLLRYGAESMVRQRDR